MLTKMNKNLKLKLRNVYFRKPKRIKCYSSTESDNDSVTSSELHCDKCGYQMTR